MGLGSQTLPPGSGLFSNLAYHLLYFVTAFFLVFIIPLYWNAFEKNQLKSFSNAFRKKDRAGYELTKLFAYFVPLLMIALVVQHYWPAEESQFPLSQSSANGHLTIFVIGSLFFIVLNKLGNQSTQISLLKIIFSYLLVLSIAYSIVFFAAMVIYKSLYLPSFIGCFIIMLLASSLSLFTLATWWKIPLLLIYFFALSAAYSERAITIFG